MLMALSLGGSAVVTYGLLPGVLGRDLPPTLDVGVLMLVWYGVLFGLLLWPLRRTGATLRSLMGPRPLRPTVRWTFVTAIGLLGVSLAAVYALFIPLSFVAPDFVSYWLFEDMPTMYFTSGEGRWLGNAVNFAVIVLLAPMVEELLFRGLLLPAWTARMGQAWAVGLSSLVFAALHADLGGAFLFAAVVAIAFLKTGTLWVPVLIHVSNNAIVWVLNLVDLATGGGSPGTVAELYETWWHGAIGLAMGAPILVAMLRRMPGPPAETPHARPQPDQIPVPSA